MGVQTEGYGARRPIARAISIDAPVFQSDVPWLNRATLLRDFTPRHGGSERWIIISRDPFPLRGVPVREKKAQSWVRMLG